jgi:DNA repair and recombination protein RAD54B
VAQGKFYGGGKTGGEKIFIGEKSSKDRKAWGGALHDPKAEGAVVMKRPPKAILTKLYVCILRTPS